MVKRERRIREPRLLFSQKDTNNRRERERETGNDDQSLSLSEERRNSSNRLGGNCSPIPALPFFPLLSSWRALSLLAPNYRTREILEGARFVGGALHGSHITHKLLWSGGGDEIMAEAGIGLRIMSRARGSSVTGLAFVFYFTKVLSGVNSGHTAGEGN